MVHIPVPIALQRFHDRDKLSKEDLIAAADSLADALQHAGYSNLDLPGIIKKLREKIAEMP